MADRAFLVGAYGTAGGVDLVQTSGYELAQINIGRLRAPLSAPQQQEFVAALAMINKLAEDAPGFVWRQQAGFGHLTGPELLGDNTIVINMSVWQSYQHLHNFTYRSRHGNYLRRRNKWFIPLPPPTTALWWVQAEQPPSTAQAVARLRYLQRYGPSPRAFTVRRRYDPTGQLEEAVRRPPALG
jgi:hypothetical protein